MIFGRNGVKMKNKHKLPLPLPLAAVREFAILHPGCWQYVDMFIKDKGKGLPDWDDMCYLPLAASLAILSKYNDDNVNNAAFVSALAGWRMYKEIYSFAPELKQMLYDQADEDMVVPVEILYKLPYKTIFIDTSDGDREKGFFVFFEHDVNSLQIELRCVGMERIDGKIEYTNNLWLHIKSGWTISDGIDAGMHTVRTKNTKMSQHQLELLSEYYKQKISRYLQLILYICSENAEISVDENRQQRTHPLTTIPKDHYREVRQWDVGVKIAKMIKHANSATPESYTQRNLSDERNSPRPHTRRGHWHHYWAGSYKNNSRQLILKWIAPMFIGGTQDDIIVTKNIVENKKTSVLLQDKPKGNEERS